MTHSVLITGGCRSGKSRHALELAARHTGPKVFLATAQALDDEMSERIEKHKEERGPGWITHEEPLDPGSILRDGTCAPGSLVILDCITLWLSNLLMASITRENILRRVDELLDVCQRFDGTVILITNEVGAGIVPGSALGREFRDLAGEINQRVAARLDEVIHTVSGIATVLKSNRKENSPLENGKGFNNPFSVEDKAGLYRAIFERRDVRHFQSKPIPPHALKRILRAAHHAGSVGFSQPWNFLVIDDPATKEKMFQNFIHANGDAEKNYSGAKRELYSSLKLEGIREAPVNVLVTCDRERAGPHVLGRNTVLETDLFSTCCAVQNLWLAARAEGVGVGWVSILSMDQLKVDLALPEFVEPVAYLCMGYPAAGYAKPMLEEEGWAKRIPLEEVVFFNHWGQTVEKRF
ncbi:fused Bifunctional adenosylcobalamin biosynthesis protein CobU/Cob(II)yrinic acid a,c-diamide reductase (modular protein) [Nitrospina gracilis 3/211]|uniref:Adenosylcobinamide kinase n=1 Tax=Nitrospina gracilis (strain 3/211) TaxID=1266370 RepID=M1ZAV6_NITG3|nr:MULTISPECIES: 5,6-dimethylbenzimidazole synthase [Nitrospina]MCF8723365.1 5,6-dimethylbenzimidazole synthase [Nitrospina sp. Nb-3]CCQ90420.1 fused Bifunctional adenosylcobalamin biosynthesis protein CobU/Cob(II)yrinic acid a,c-diamide reductase (modular protein) [Nitrospina gracilis 3/211]